MTVFDAMVFLLYSLPSSRVLLLEAKWKLAKDTKRILNSFVRVLRAVRTELSPSSIMHFSEEELAY